MDKIDSVETENYDEWIGSERRRRITILAMYLALGMKEDADKAASYALDVFVDTFETKRGILAYCNAVWKEILGSDNVLEFCRKRVP